MDAVRAFLRHPAEWRACAAHHRSGRRHHGAVVFPTSPWEMTGTPFAPPARTGCGSGGIRSGAMSRRAWRMVPVSLLIGIASALAAMAIGVVIGAISGYFGGKVDLVLMRVTELFRPSRRSFCNPAGCDLQPVAAHHHSHHRRGKWPPLARLTRAEFLRLRGREFVEAALCQGESTTRIVLGHILRTRSRRSSSSYR